MLERFDPRRNASMPIKRFRNDFTQMMNRFFDEPFFQSQTSFMPAINVKEEPEQYIVEAELPGMDMKDVDIEISGNILTLSGERRHESTKEEEKQTHMTESSYGAFRRSFTLPDHIDMEQITAECRKGILYIRIPKDKTKEARKIDIQDIEH